MLGLSDLVEVGHLVIGVAPEQFSVDVVILLADFDDRVPDVVIEVVRRFDIGEAEVLHIQLFPQRMREFAHQSRLIARLQLFLVLVLYHHSELSVPVPKQAAVVDVGRPYQGYPVVNDH